MKIYILKTVVTLLEGLELEFENTRQKGTQVWLSRERTISVAGAFSPAAVGISHWNYDGSAFKKYHASKTSRIRHLYDYQVSFLDLQLGRSLDIERNTAYAQS